MPSSRGSFGYLRGRTGATCPFWEMTESDLQLVGPTQHDLDICCVSASACKHCICCFFGSTVGQHLVRLGNMCCARFALLVLLCFALQIHWVDP